MTCVFPACLHCLLLLLQCQDQDAAQGGLWAARAPGGQVGSHCCHRQQGSHGRAAEEPGQQPVFQSEKGGAAGCGWGPGWSGWWQGRDVAAAKAWADAAWPGAVSLGVSQAGLLLLLSACQQQQSVGGQLLSCVSGQLVWVGGRRRHRSRLLAHWRVPGKAQWCAEGAHNYRTCSLCICVGIRGQPSWLLSGMNLSHIIHTSLKSTASPVVAI